MKIKLVFSLFFISAFFVLMMNLVQCTTTPVEVVPFSFSAIDAGIKITSPVSNMTYLESTIQLTVILYLSGTELVPESHKIPYEQISCVYSLDDGEWENASFVSNTKSHVWKSFVNELWYNQMDCTYTAILHDIPDGLHTLRVAVKPAGIRSYNSHDVDDREATVEFTTSDQSSIVSIIMQQPELITILVVIIISIIAIVAIFKKKRRT